MITASLRWTISPHAPELGATIKKVFQCSEQQHRHIQLYSLLLKPGIRDIYLIVRRCTYGLVLVPLIFARPFLYGHPSAFRDSLRLRLKLGLGEA